MPDRVGASIVEIITESLYDKPIVVFREYVQNSADSLLIAERNGDSEDLFIKIWKKEDSLFFLDNGIGIAPEEFRRKMGSIAKSTKARIENIGYKGIGRLSGLSYCRRLIFVNIINYKNRCFQVCSVDCQKYTQLRKNGSLNALQFADLMDVISEYDDHPDASIIEGHIRDYYSLFEIRDTGFLVIMESISPVLNATIEDQNFLENLSWLLPVPFEDELLSANADGDSIHELFQELSSNSLSKSQTVVPAKSYSITYDSKQLKRPIFRERLREYLCKSSLEKYAVCVHTFSNTGITINNNNPFSGIRIYVDNILLCDESELIPALQQFGMISHTVNETIQAVRGIGAVVYIVDKVNISANARRTFIDVTDEDALNFLKLIGEFIENVFQTRYALSKYYSAKKRTDNDRESLITLREKAEKALMRLASKDVLLEDDPVEVKDFVDLELTEKKKIIKTKITKDINTRIKRYLDQTTDFSIDTYFKDFLIWLKAN